LKQALNCFWNLLSCEVSRLRTFLDFARRSFRFVAAIDLRSFLIFAFEHAASVRAGLGRVLGEPARSCSSELNERAAGTCPGASTPRLASAELGVTDPHSRARQAMTVRRVTLIAR
jgi:hypothetical protein